MNKKDQKIIADSEAAGIPIFVLKASDRCALAAIQAYFNQCHAMGCKEEHLEGIRVRLDEFHRWKKSNPKDIKLPD
jgi:hypothetical protein